MNPLILITGLLAICSLAAGNGWEPPVIKVIHKTVHIPKVGRSIRFDSIWFDFLRALSLCWEFALLFHPHSYRSRSYRSIS